MKCSQCGHTLQQDGTCHICDSHDVLSPGTMLEGRYKVLGVVGSGGMGFVYKAIDTRLHNSVVAVKEMRAGVKGQHLLDKARKSFESEARMLSGLSHRSLPGVTDFFSVDKKWYLIMDFIDGINLEKYVENYGPIDEEQTLRWAISLCDVLEYLHFQDPPIIFRDLKPSNIMLDSDGQLKLIDFGIARNFKPDTGSDTTYYFSSGFSPPEQYGEAQTDVRSDIYALAATLHYLVTGFNPRKNPFEFANIQDVVDVSDQFNNTILKSVSLAPADRPSSVAEFRAMLAGDLAAELRSSEDDGADFSDYRVSSLKPRSKVFTFLPLAALLVAIVGGGVWGYTAINNATINMQRSAGLSNLEETNYSIAISNFSDVLERRPGDITAIIGLAECYVATGMKSDAEPLLLDAINNNPDEPKLYLTLADFYIDWRRFEDARMLLESFTGEHEGITSLKLRVLSMLRAYELHDSATMGMGNTTGNLSNRGRAVLAGEWIYYSVIAPDHQGLYKVRTDGSDKTLLLDGAHVEYMNLYKNWIYYIDDAGYVRRFDIHNHEDTMVFDGRFSYIAVHGDMFYGLRVSGDLMSSKLPEEPVKLTMIGSNEIVVSDGWIYFSSSSARDYGFFKIRKDGTRLTELLSYPVTDINVVDGSIYFRNRGTSGSLENNRIYRMVFGQQNPTQIVSGANHRGLNVSGEWIYYTNVNHGRRLYRVRTDGSENMMLNWQSLVEHIYVVGDWVIFQANSGYVVYMIPLDGSKEIRLH